MPVGAAVKPSGWYMYKIIQCYKLRILQQKKKSNHMTFVILKINHYLIRQKRAFIIGMNVVLCELRSKSLCLYKNLFLSMPWSHKKGGMA